MRILLTGAGGFVGSHLLSNLAAAGHEVVGTTRSGGRSAHAELRVLGEAELSAGLPGDFDAVVHVGGATPANGAGPGAWEESLRFSRHLGRAIAESPVRTVIHLSSVAVLGGPRTLSRGPLDDHREPAPESEYGRTKAETEVLFNELARPDRLVINLRPPLVYGPGATGSWAQLRTLARSPLPLPFATVNNRRSFLGIDNLSDLVGAVLGRAGEGGLSGSYLAADRELVSLREVVAALRGALGRRPGLFPFPGFVMAAPLRWVGRSEAASGLFDDLVLDASRIAETFAWKPRRPTLEGMALSLTNPPMTTGA